MGFGRKNINDAGVNDLKTALMRIRGQANSENIRITQHAQQEMVEENISLDEVLEATASGDILENYPEHRRGACCLLHGFTQSGRPPHCMYNSTASPDYHHGI